jgi:hypothetical protein
MPKPILNADSGHSFGVGGAERVAEMTVRAQLWRDEMESQIAAGMMWVRDWIFEWKFG